MRLKLVVIFTHVALLFFLARSAPTPKSVSKPLSVHTHTLITPTPKLAASPSPSSPIPRPLPDKPKPKLEKKSVAPPKKAPATKASKPDRRALIGALKKSLASFETDSTPSKTPSLTSTPLASETLVQQASYEQAITATLQNALTLPRSGNIELEVTLTRAGALEKLRIKNATNSNNKTYLEEALPRVLFPPFGNNFRGEKSHTFVITLTSL